MNIINKTMISALLALSALGLTASRVYADAATDAGIYCTGCHDGLTVNGIVAAGGGARDCPQRTVAEWTSTIDRMNGKGCGVPAGTVSAIANYLAGLGAATTTTTAAPTTTTAAPTTTTAAPTTTTVASTTTTTASGNGQTAANTYCTGCHDGLTVNGIVAAGGGARDCPQRTVAEWTSTIDRMNGKGCGVPAGTVSAIANYLAGLGGVTTTTTTTTAAATTTTAPTTTTTIACTCTTITSTSTTIATTTTTTLAAGCPINGTTNYRYSGTGTCHGHDSHEVRDQKWCQQHMTHFNSKGNHTHSYPHPTCD